MLRNLLNPKSIAIIGASRSEKKLGYIVLKNLIDFGFTGNLYPINPNTESINNLKCWKSISDLQEIPDLVIISLPAELVNNEVKKSAKFGAKNFLIFSAGFKEVGEEGEKLETELKEISKKYNLNIIGPNCLGFVNNLFDINATFGKVGKTVGNLRFISQSGAIATSIFDFAEYSNLGFREFITLGNKTIINENTILDFWLNDEFGDINSAKKYFLDDKRLSDLSPIGIYLESIEDGRKFIDLATKITKKDPVFMLKPGKSTAAKQAMQSHTGSIAGEDSVLDAALEKSNVIRCDGIEDLFDYAKGFSFENPPSGPNIAIISNAGGPAVVSTDFVDKEGLKLAEIKDEVREKLENYLPRSANFHNPIDVLGDALAIRYAHSIDLILGQKDIDALLVILTPQIMTEIQRTAEFIGRLAAQHKKPVFCSFMGGSEIEVGEKILNRYKIPSFRFPERAIKVIGKMWKWKKSNLEISDSVSEFKYESKLNKEVIKILQKTISDNKFKSVNIALDNFKSNEILKLSGINTPETQNIKDLKEAFEFTKKSDFPVVLKVSSEKILHKTDIGGVITNIGNNIDLEIQFKQLQKNIEKLDVELQKTINIQIQKQVDKGIELIIGMKRDINFGPVMMFGAGGTLAELIEDRNLEIVTIKDTNFEKIVKNSKVFKLLSGYRGEDAYNLDKIYDLMNKLANLFLINSEIEEIEINPLILNRENIWAVDGKCIVNTK